MESLLSMLQLLHMDYFIEKNFNTSDLKCKPVCPSHKIFCLVVEETLKCECGVMTRRNWDYSAFAHTFYIAQVFEESKGQPEKLAEVPDELLEDYVEYSSVAACENQLCYYLKMQWQCLISMCPKEAGTCDKNTTSKTLTLLEAPKVYIIHLIWENSRPLLLNLLQAYSTIPYTFNINSIYNSGISMLYSLTSMILFGSSHYISLIRKTNVWFKVDDEHIQVIGKWKDVIRLILNSRFYPVGLFYSQTRNFENNEINLKDWMELEKLVVLQSEVREFKNQSGWSCSCGNFNNEMFDICEKCQILKPGVIGWVCSFCTTLNTENNFCQTCTNPQTSQSLKTSRPTTVNYNKILKNVNNPAKPLERQKYFGTPGLKCKFCERKIKGDLFICFNCYIKNKNNICQICNSKASNEYCDLCIRSNRKCDCGERIHIMDGLCKCKMR